MTVSIRRMLIGQGAKYLLDGVTAADGQADRTSPLTRYYAETGTPPGRFLGAGMAGLAGGAGVVAGSECTEEALTRMLNECADPATGERLTGRPRPGSVAGFDLTFSVPKSISAAWAVADAGTQSVIFQAHQDAIRRTIAHAEKAVFTSRSGRNGIVREDVRGVVAAGFDHWDSRAGDPQLHTHLVVQNRVQGVDGTWRTVDSRALYRNVVTLSELHQGVLQDLLTARLGWGWDARKRRYSAVPRWEASGVRDELMAEFSQRSGQIEQSANAAIARFAQSHGRQPTDVEKIRMRQTATLATRPDKHHRSLHEMTEGWRERARPFVGDDTVAWVCTLGGRNDLPLLRADDLAEEMLTDLATSVVNAVSGSRATFTRANLLAEIHRQLHGVRFADPDDRIAVAERTADLATGRALALTPPEILHVPARFRDAQGRSRFVGRLAGVFTTETLLAAEDRLIAAGRDTTGPTVMVATVARVADSYLPGRDYPLSTDQALACEQIATSGRVLDVLVGPAGTGKSTTMAGLRDMWQAQHGTGSVVGLAPSAAAAEVLADELGVDTENTAKWLTEWRRQPDHLAEIAELQRRLAPRRGHQPGHRGAAPPSEGRRAADAARLAALRAETQRWGLRRGQLVIVDEASLAGTFALDELVGAARDAGAKVLLAGDWAQLSAVEAGGAFSMLVRDRDFAPELTDVRRFRNDWEKAASVRLRVGDAHALDDYQRHGRIVDGDRDEVLDDLYTAWKKDTDAGLSSLMIAGDAATVGALNERARADRVAAGEVTEAGVELSSGGRAGVGDRVATRQNDRRLSTGKRWVKNGDRWDVTQVFDDGSLAVKRAGRGGEVVLPADYARQHEDLGYACTAHRAQGATVDTAHTMIAPTTTREVLYVGATRGRQANTLYVDTHYDPDPDTQHGHTAEAQTARDVLAKVLATPGADRSAHDTIVMEQEEAGGMVRLSAEYRTIAGEAQRERWAALVETSGMSGGQVAQVFASEAYGPLTAALRDAEARGLDVDTGLPALAAARPLDDADDPAAVLHGRVQRWVRASQPGRRPPRDRTVVGLIAVAQQVHDAGMRQALDERAQAMEQRAAEVLRRGLQAGSPWARSLGRPPSDLALRAEWERQGRTVAAFVDLYGAGHMEPAQAHSRTEQGDAIAADRAAKAARAIARRDRDQQQEPAPTGAMAAGRQDGVDL